MTTYIIDFETTFSSDHTLTRHSIEEYVRHPKFEVIGCGYLCLDDGLREFLDHEDFDNFLREAGPARLVAHHAQFDGFVLSEHYGFTAAYWLDTLSMSRALWPRLPKHSLEAMAAYLFLGTPKVVPYNKFRGLAVKDISPELLEEIGRGCLHDIELTHRLYDICRPQMPESELDLIDETIRLYTEPRLVGDIPLLGEALEEAIVARETKMTELGLSSHVLRSQRKFVSLLLGAGLDHSELPRKTSPATGKSTYAFAKSDIGFLALREHDNPHVRAIVEARLDAQTSIHETRAGRLLSSAERGAIPIYLKYYGAHTGRFSGGDRSNFQNLPRGSKLRNALRAPPGHRLVWGDLSQIECRITAWLAGCTALLDAFREGRDVYSEFGTRAFGCEVSKTVNPRLRFFSKETVLGCGYGMGGAKFHPYLESRRANLPEPFEMLSRFETDSLIRMFRQGYWETPELWGYLNRTLDQMYHNPLFEAKIGPVEIIGRKVILPNGMFLDYHDMRYLREGEPLTENLKAKKDGYYIGSTSLWGGSFLENIVQALARIVITDIWLDLRHAAKCVLQVHDELVFVVPLKFEQGFKDILEKRMIVPPSWMPDIPLGCEVGSGEAYGK